MMLPLPSISTTRAPAARMMTARPTFSILFSTGVTLAERHWVTSDERRRVPMKSIRQALDYVAQQYPSPHPLLTQGFATDGYSLFVEKIEGLIENASKIGQLGIEAVLRDLLLRIDRDGRRLPRAISRACCAGGTRIRC
jgi:hypothetical protein